MANEGPYEDLVSTNERPRLLLLRKDDPNSRQPSHPDAPLPPIEITEVDKPPCKSRKDAMFSAPPGENERRFPQESSSDDDLLDSINSLDVETDQVELTTSFRIRHREPEAYDDSADNGEDVQGPPAERPRSIAEVIYAENKKKARLAHAVLDKLGPESTQPLYDQPSDTAIYHENKKRYQEFKKTLMLHLKRKAQERQARAESFSDSRNRPMSASPNEMGQRGSRAEWKINEQKQRQFFEEQFPELKKALREQLRLSKGLAKPGKRKRMGADMQVILGLQEPAKEKRRKLGCAIIPPLLSGEQRPPRHVDFRNLVKDPLAELEERHSTNVWDDREEIFREMFIQHPKQFDVIASCLGRKSVADCVQYYYLSKKSDDYKQLTRKQRSPVTLRASQRKTLASSVPVRDPASSSGSSSLPTNTSAMVMTEITIPYSPDGIPCAAATNSGSGNAATPAPPLSQDKDYQLD